MPTHPIALFRGETEMEKKDGNRFSCVIFGERTYVPLFLYRIRQKKLSANQYFMTSQCVFNCRKNDIYLKKRRNGLFFFLLLNIWEKESWAHTYST